MSEKLVRKVALAALAGKEVHAPDATNKEISLAVMEAAERGIVEASDVTNLDSHHPEWLLIGPTGLTERYVRESRISKKVWVGALAVIGVLIGFAKWLIPILVSLLKGGN